MTLASPFSGHFQGFLLCKLLDTFRFDKPAAKKRCYDRHSPDHDDRRALCRRTEMRKVCSKKYQQHYCPKRASLSRRLNPPPMFFFTFNLTQEASSDPRRKPFPPLGLIYRR
jgi:hypothetical protein